MAWLSDLQAAAVGRFSAPFLSCFGELLSELDSEDVSGTVWYFDHVLGLGYGETVILTDEKCWSDGVKNGTAFDYHPDDSFASTSGLHSECPG